MPPKLPQNSSTPLQGLQRLPTYDPQVVSVIQASNQLSQTPDEQLVFGAPTTENETGARAFLTEQDLQKLRKFLPGMSDQGLMQLKYNVAHGIGVKK